MLIRLQAAAGVAVLLLLALSACQRGVPPPAANPIVTLGPENVASVEDRPLRSGPLVSGRLEPRLIATVRSEIPGQVLDVEVEAGQQVKKGQLLAKIDPSSSPVQLEAAKAALQSARRSLRLARIEEDRVRDLARAGAIAKQELDRAVTQTAQAAAQVDQAQAQLAAAQEQVSRARVFAPFDGVVSEREIYSGDLVQPGSPLFTVVDPSDLHLEASVPSEERAKIVVGAPVQFSVAGYQGHITGKVERINPVLDPATGQLRVFVAVPNTNEHSLLGGLYAEGRIATDEVNAPSVPVDALNVETNPPTVLLINDDALKRVPVKVGLRDEVAERVQLLDGPKPGTLVVTGDVRDLPPGTKVKLVRPQQPTGQQGDAGEGVGGAAREGAED